MMTIEYVLTKSVRTQSTLPAPPAPDACYIRLTILYNCHSTIHSGRPRKACELPGFRPLAVPLSFYIFIPSAVVLPCLFFHPLGYHSYYSGLSTSALTYS